MGEEVQVERGRLAIAAAGVDAVTMAVHRPPAARDVGVLLAPGAGGDLDGAPLVALADVLASLGLTTVRTNLPYREAGRRAAPRAEASVDHYAALARAADDAVPAVVRWVVGGKSYGCRVASMALAEGLPAAGLLCYGYPLHPPSRPDRVRVAHWSAIAVPSLFLQGTRDPFADLALLEAHRPTLGAPSTVRVVVGGDHSLHVAAKASPDGRAHGPRSTLAGLADHLGAWVDALD